MGEEDRVLVTNIQRMCFHDGPGIRTTVFLKGCNLHCPWCANPENISPSVQEYELDGRKGVYGKIYSCVELLEEVLKDRAYYGDDGGVTFSGGEPLLQISKLSPLLERLKELGISTAIETALHVPLAAWEGAADLIDHYMVDLKILDDSLCGSVIGGDVCCYEDNFEYLEKLGKSITIRIPLNHEYTMKEENMHLIEEFLKIHYRFPVEIFAMHDLGAKKYESLKIEPPALKEVTANEIKTVADILAKNGSAVIINKL